MGGVDKGLVELNGQPLIEQVITRIEPQISSLIISVNRNLDRYRRYGYPLIVDPHSGQGPLAGILCALQQCQSDWLLTTPCDAPHLPVDLVTRMCETAHNTPATLYTAHDGKQLQPLFSLIKRGMATTLQDYIESGQRKVALWLEQQGCVNVDFSDQTEAFTNINTLEMLNTLRECKRE